MPIPTVLRKIGDISPRRRRSSSGGGSRLLTRWRSTPTSLDLGAADDPGYPRLTAEQIRDLVSTGLTASEIEQRYREFASLTDGRPEKVKINVFPPNFKKIK